MSEPNNLSRFTLRLAELLESIPHNPSEIDLHLLANFMREPAPVAEELARFRKFDENHYQRNSILKTDKFDILLICWRPGQHSLIHDHAGSVCCLRVLEGTATEIQYRKTECGFAKEVRRRVFNQGYVCSAFDSDIHQVANFECSDLVTLHAYSPPLKMRTYELEPVAEKEVAA